MRLAIFGLGYVGTVSAACLAQRGHKVFGVDINEQKVGMINAGQSPIVEAGVPELIQQAVQAGRLRATIDSAAAIAWADASLICVGTPSRPNGSLDLTYAENVLHSIGSVLAQRSERQTVIIRSTLLPGTTLGHLRPILEEAAGKTCGPEIGLAYNPEFLREGSAVQDFEHPPYTVVGGIDEASISVAAAVYAGIDAPLHIVPIPEAEMLKYASNAFHALKITFANEIGVLCKELGIDSHAVMDVFVQDTRLNVSSKYLRPGFAFGGSCLPKDLRAIVHRARSLDLDLPVLNAILPSNGRQIEYAYQMIRRTGRKKLGILGLSFKAGTDDLRESPIVHLVEKLLGKGYDLRIYDKDVIMARITGANKQYIEQVIPHLSSLIVQDINQVLSHAEVVVIGNGAPEFQKVLGQLRDGQQLIDLVRIEKDISQWDGDYYQGICW